MHAQNCRRVCRRLYGQIGGLPWTTGAQRGLSGSTFGSTLPKASNAIVRSRSDDRLWVKAGMTCRVGAMVRKVEGLGGFREMGVTQRPSFRSSEHGMRVPEANAADSPEKIEEQEQDEFLQKERKKQLPQPPSDDGDVDRHGIHNLSVDEEVKRGLIADSEHPLGRVEKINKAEDSSSEENTGSIDTGDADLLEHGSFKPM